MRDTRIDQMRALVDDARCILSDIDEEGGLTPVDQARLRRVNEYLRFAIAASDYFIKPYPDERHG